MSAQDILDKLEAVTRCADGWKSRCPAHHDMNPSLAVTEKDGMILLHCHAGCSFESILTALNLTPRDLSSNGQAKGRVVATYDYTDEAGKLLFQTVRYEPKGFRQRHSDGKGDWVWNLKDVRRVLYNLPEVLGADSVVVLEGEKDADTARKFGLVATSNPMGAGKWRAEYSDALRAKHVTIIPDSDQVGLAHAEQIARSIHLKAASVKIAKLPDGIKDLSDWADLSREELARFIDAATQWTPEREPETVFKPEPVSDERNDETNGKLFVQLNPNRFLYCSTIGASTKGWLAWRETHWGHSDGTEFSDAYLATERVREHLRKEAAATQGDEEEVEKAWKWAVASGNVYKKDAMLKHASMMLNVPIAIFDRDPMLIACKNGVVDLRAEVVDDKLRAARREDYATRCANARYDTTKTCPAFDRFLEEIMEGDEQMIKYLWRVMGYALTGDVRERAFFILHGGGRNGKTTFLETLMALMGSYAQKARFASFVRNGKDGASANSDVAHMAGARVIVSTESDETDVLNTSLIKELTGGDSIRARFLYGKEFDFVPVAKFFFGTNSVPNIYETTDAIWDRVHFIPFTYRVPENKIDKLLLLKLRDELDAIFSQAVNWCSIWQAEGGLNPPEKVRRDVKAQRESMDTLSEWHDERTEKSSAERSTNFSDLYDDYVSWHERTNKKTFKPRSRKALGLWLVSKGYAPVKETDKRAYRGLTIKAYTL